MMAEYIAFLRGVNSGHNPTVKMEALRKVFAELGFQNVRTVLASGNVIFTANRKPSLPKLEAALSSELGYPVAVVLLSSDQLRQLVASDPFKRTMNMPQARPFVTFLHDKPKSVLKLPHSNPEKGYTILAMKDGAVLSVVHQTGTTPDLMSVLDKLFGRRVTTRSWNTIEKILKQTAS